MTYVKEGGGFLYLPTGATLIQGIPKADSPDSLLARTMPKNVYIIRYARTMPKILYITWRSEHLARTMPKIPYIIRSPPDGDRILYVARSVPNNVNITLRSSHCRPTCGRTKCVRKKDFFSKRSSDKKNGKRTKNVLDRFRSTPYITNITHQLGDFHDEQQ